MALARQNTGKWQRPKKNKKYCSKIQKHGESVLFYVRKPEKRQKRTKRHKLGTKCNSFQPVFHILCTKKKKYLWTITFSLSHWDLFSARLQLWLWSFALPEDS